MSLGINCFCFLILKQQIEIFITSAWIRKNLAIKIRFIFKEIRKVKFYFNSLLVIITKWKKTNVLHRISNPAFLSKRHASLEESFKKFEGVSILITHF